MPRFGRVDHVSQAHHFPAEVLEEIVDAETDAQVLLRPVDGRFLVWHHNRAARALFVLADEAPVHDIVPPALADLLTSTCDSVWASGRAVNLTDLPWPVVGRAQPRHVDVRVRRLYGGVSLKCLDVSAQHRAQADLRESQERYKMLAEYSSDVVFASDHGVLKWVSPSVKSVLGWRPSEMVGKSITEFLHPEDLTVMAGAANGVDAGHPARYEARFRRQDGSWLWLAITARPQYDDQGHVSGRIGSGRDISSRVAAEQALHASEREVREEREVLRSILDSSLDPQVVLQAVHDEDQQIVDFRFTDCNSAATAYLRRARRDLLGRSLHDLFAGAASLQSLSWMRSVIATGDPFVAHGISLFPSVAGGDERWYDISITALPGGVTFTWRDVTSTYRDARALADSEDLFRRTMENSPVALCLIAPDGSFMAVNRALCELLGRDEQTLHTTTWQELTYPEDLSVDLDLVADLSAGRRESYRLTKRYLRPDMSVVWGELSVSCVRNGDGSVRYFISQILDITELVQRRQALAQSERHYRLLAENTSDVVAIINAEGRFDWISPSVTGTFGWQPEEVIGKQVREFIDGEDWRRVASVMATNKQGMHMSGAFRVRQHSGAVLWVDAVANTVTDAAGRVVRIARMRDVDTEHRAQQRLRRSEERFRTAMNSSPVGMALLDERGVLVQVNDALCALMDEAPQDLTGRPLWDLGAVVSDADEWLQLVNSDQTAITREAELRSAGGGRVYVRAALAVIRDEDGQRRSVVAQFIDVTQQRKAQALLEFQANHDPLTNLKNRRAVMSVMASVQSHPARTGDRLAVLYCDIDHFKPVNDQYGHGLGDEVLTEVGRRIRRCVRVGDTVGRFGGDEFVVLLVGVHGAADARAVSDKIRRAVAEPIEAHDVSVRVTVSIGVAVAAQQEDPDDLLAAADQALFRAKQSGRNAVVVFDEIPG